MTSSAPAHSWVLPPTQAAKQDSPDARLDAPPEDGMPITPAPYLEVQCHRRLRGPYTGAGTLLRSVVPALLAVDTELVAARAIEIVTMAPELAPMIPVPPQTLTNLAHRAERTRFYSVARTLRLSHGGAELLMDWARLLHPGGVGISFADLDDADPCDREFVSVLLRRCDPKLLSVVAEAGRADDPLGQALARHARQATRRPQAKPYLPAGADLAQLFIDSDGTHQDPAVCQAYAGLPAPERASRHTARAEALAALDEPSLRLGAIPYHLEHGIDPMGVGGEALTAACDDCFDLGCYEASLELAMRGRELVAEAGKPELYWNFTNKVGACLSYLKRGSRGFAYFDELRRITANPDVHMNSCYMMAMLYTRHLPPGDHDEFRALEWVNTAIAIADRNPDPHKRVFVGAFMRNARALVELHRGDPQCALALVNEAIAMTDADLGPDEQLLHRSVLLYNRAQILNALGDYAASLRDYDVVISRDPEYGDYYFERAGVRRTAGAYDEALADYATAIKLSPPFHEAHYNRADLLRELGDEDGALRDIDYAIVLDPDHVDSRVNRVDLLLERGETERAHADIDAGLELDPSNANLLSARGSLLADAGDIDAAYASYTAALTEDPTFAAAWANRAVVSYSADRPADAVADLDRAIALADDPWLRVNRAIALQDLNQHRRAVADLNIAVAVLEDGDPDLLYRRGVSRHALGDADGALADWSAHLRAYSPGGSSPYAEEIKLRAGGLLTGDLVVRAKIPENVS
jgi:tetratricopeptide (TPR) repeat protein